MSGKARKNARHIYSNCRPQLNHAGRPDRFPGHPANVYVRADLLTDAVHRFFATRLLGPDRHVHLLADLESGGPFRLLTAGPHNATRCAARSPTLISAKNDFSARWRHRTTPTAC